MNDIQQALAELHDIHEPAAISWWPPAPGWWLLLIAVPLLLWLIHRLWQRRQRDNYVKLAKIELSNIVINWQTQRNNQKSASDLALLIRRVMIAKYGNREVAGLYGEKWLRYLDTKSGSQFYSQGSGQVLATVLFQKNTEADVEALIEASKDLFKKI